MKTKENIKNTLTQNHGGASDGVGNRNTSMRRIHQLVFFEPTLNEEVDQNNACNSCHETIWTKDLILGHP